MWDSTNIRLRNSSFIWILVYGTVTWVGSFLEMHRRRHGWHDSVLAFLRKQYHYALHNLGRSYGSGTENCMLYGMGQKFMHCAHGTMHDMASNTGEANRLLAWHNTSMSYGWYNLWAFPKSWCLRCLRSCSMTWLRSAHFPASRPTMTCTLFKNPSSSPGFPIPHITPPRRPLHDR